MVVLNRMDRFQLALDVVRRVPRLKSMADRATQRFTEMMQRHKSYVSEYGEDMPEVANWKWAARGGAAFRQPSAGVRRRISDGAGNRSEEVGKQRKRKACVFGDTTARRSTMSGEAVLVVNSGSSSLK